MEVAVLAVQRGPEERLRIQLAQLKTLAATVALERASLLVEVVVALADQMGQEEMVRQIHRSAWGQLVVTETQERMAVEQAGQAQLEAMELRFNYPQLMVQAEVVEQRHPPAA